jgi:hypothetical protein
MRHQQEEFFHLVDAAEHAVNLAEKAVGLAEMALAAQGNPFEDIDDVVDELGDA